MAKKVSNISELLNELMSTKQFSSQAEAMTHIERSIPAIERLIAEWDNLNDRIRSTYGELDNLSNKKFRLFNVKTFRDELDEVEHEFHKKHQALKEAMENANAEWLKMSAEGIQEGSKEWMIHNNKLLGLQAQNLEAVKKAASKVMEVYRNGSNVFDRFAKTAEESTKGFVKGIGEFKKGYGEAIGSIKEWTEPWAKANQAASVYAKNIGLGAAGMKNLLSETIRFANQSQIGIKYNKSLEEMIKLQQEYSNAVGRNIGLTDGYKESLAAMSAVMGDQKTADISSKLENFGINPEETGRRMGLMFADASKKGIAFSKYSDNFANNIKMAQNYTFANGVKGVASMVEKATKLKLEMQSVAQFAEKVNTVEGAITTGAKLQVLGGSFSQFANPLQMLYEGTSDAEGLQDRIINMFGDLGRFNKLTGEVEVSAFDRQRIRAAGEAIGVNSAELMDMIHAKGKRNEIANQMRGLGYSDELQELIMNTATFDTNGNAGVSINGEFVGVDQLAGREAELIALNQSESEDIKEIATLLRGWDDTMQGFQKQKDIKQASWVEKSGIGSFAMTAVQYLGQANWALNTIVGLLTAGKAINFGKGAFGMLQGGTRTVATAGAPIRFNNWMKKEKLDGLDLKRDLRHAGKNMGVMIAPDNSFNRKDMRSLIKDFHKARGASRGAATGTMPLNPIPRNSWFIPPTTSAGTPSLSPVISAGGTGNPMNMGFGTPSMSPIMLQGTGNINTNPIAVGSNEWRGAPFLTPQQKEDNEILELLSDIELDNDNAPKGFKNKAKGALANTGSILAVMSGAIASMGLQAGSSAIEAKRQEQIANGTIKENSNEDWRRRNISGAMNWVGSGAMLGSQLGMMFGPMGALIGAGIGGVLGGTAGFVKGKMDQRKTQEKIILTNKISRFINGRQLTGDYSIETLNRIAKYLETNDSSYINQSDINALKSNGNDYNMVIKKKMARGGLINGPLHTNGGVSVAGTGIELEGGEFVINRKSALKNIGILKKINSGTNIQPQPLNTQSMMVAPNINTPQISNVGTSEIALKPLDININGTIKIDAGKGNQVDITKLLLDNPKFLRDITEMIEKQINITTNGGYNKEKSLNKF